MTFKDQMLTDAQNSLLNTDEFAESIIYTPYGKWPVTINALVIRGQIDKDGQTSIGIGQKTYELFILNDATSGITSVNKGKDIVSLPVNSGDDTAVDFVIVDIISKDDALWHLHIQR